jgi:DMSO/TMAO reductase YedYZ molybdopterin-dependent catalytic subunit
MSLPPGQRRIDGFPRFGTHLDRPPPAIPTDPVIEISGVVTKALAVRPTEFAALPRRELVTDFHCVAGWSATDLRWEGVGFESFYRNTIEPLILPETSVTHLVFEGLDGYRSIVQIEDALVDDVLIAERLNGQPLDGDHGAPIRLVSPKQYGYISTKHLCRIEVHAGAPAETYHRSRSIQVRLQLVKPHRRARVWQEERHRYLPAWSVRRVYWLLVRPIASLSARGTRKPR